MQVPNKASPTLKNLQCSNNSKPRASVCERKNNISLREFLSLFIQPSANVIWSLYLDQTSLLNILNLGLVAQIDIIGSIIGKFFHEKILSENSEDNIHR